jgi:ribosomal protein S27AE
MQAHPHVHVIITGGALVKTEEGYRWQEAKKTFLFPVKQLSKDFRKAFCAGVRRLLERGDLETEFGKLDVEGMLAEAESKDWEVYIQPPVAGIENLLAYLGRYIFRIAISNNRIVKVEGGKVTFKYRDNRDGGKEKEMKLTAVEFIRRFLLHVLPQRFMRIRHYGLHHSSCREKLGEARRLLGLAAMAAVTVKLKLVEWLKEVLEKDPRLCPRCGEGKMVRVRDFGRWTPEWKLKLAPLFGILYKWRLG